MENCSRTLPEKDWLESLAPAVESWVALLDSKIAEVGLLSEKLGVGTLFAGGSPFEAAPVEVFCPSVSVGPAPEAAVTEAVILVTGVAGMNFEA
jgi:hypothetical protein